MRAPYSPLLPDGCYWTIERYLYKHTSPLHCPLTLKHKLCILICLLITHLVLRTGRDAGTHLTDAPQMNNAVARHNSSRRPIFDSNLLLWHTLDPTSFVCNSLLWLFNFTFCPSGRPGGLLPPRRSDARGRLDPLDFLERTALKIWMRGALSIASL